MRTVVLRIDAFDTQRHSFPMSLREWPPPAPGGGLIANADLPLSPAGAGVTDLQGLRQYLDGRRQIFVDANTDDPALTSLGEELHAWIGQGTVADELAGLPAGSRLVLDVRPPELGALPWEMLRNAADHYFLGLDPDRPVSRGRLDRPLNLPQHEWPLRFLIVVASDAADSRVNAQDELARLYEVLRGCEPDLDLLVLRRQSRSDLLARLRAFKPHILHFIGHGNVRPGAAGKKQAFLQLCQETGQPTQWIADDIITDLRALGSLRLAFINACRTDDATSDGLWTITDALLTAGVPAVVGARANVRGDLASAFAAKFYASLAEHRPLDVALTEARIEVYGALDNGSQSRDWAAPSLQLRALPEDILNIGMGIDGAWRTQLFTYPKFRDLRRCVDRWSDRMQTWQALAAQKQKLLVMSGPTGMGKTTLAMLVLERCALRGFDVRYADMAGRSGRFFSVLRGLRQGLPNAGKTPPALTAPLPDQHFADFDSLYGNLLGAVPPDREHEEPYRQAIEEAHRRAEALFDVFCAGLDHMVQERPLLLVVDHLDMEPGEFGYLKAGLLNWCAARSREPSLHLLLIPKPDSSAPLDLDGLSYQRIEVGRFPKQGLDELARELLERNLEPRPDVPKADAEAEAEGMLGMCRNCPRDVPPTYLINLIGALGSSTWQPRP